MKNWLILVMAAIGFVPGWSPALRAADTDEESKLIQVLQSAAPPAQKDAACARLKFIGMSRCVPGLAALLTDEQLSHSARYALEPMRSEEAGSALLDALGKTKGLMRLGIINSLAVRGDERAVPGLVELLRDPDVGTESASARALGQIGGSEAIKALRASARNSSGKVHESAIDALLRCANRLLASGQRSGALAIFEQLDGEAEGDSIRVAAFTGRVRASGNAGLSLVLHAISGPAGPSQMAALQLVRELQVPNATKELAKLLADLQPPVQIALVGGLAQREDPAALPALVALAGNAQQELRLPLIQAFDSLGDASIVGLLAKFAASGSVDEQTAARRALADLRRGDVTQSLIDQLSSSSPEVQAELARALGARGDTAAVPKLLDLAHHGPESARKGVLQALSILADDSQLGALVDLVLQAKVSAERAQAAETLNSAYQHILVERGHADPAPLVQGMQKGSNEARAALLPICGGLVDPQLRATLRIALHDQDSQVHAAAVRAICDTIDPELLEDLLQLARLTKEDSVRTLAIDGGVRLVTQEDSVKLPADRRVAALKVLLACAGRPEQKRKVLAGLAEVPDLQAMEAVGTELDEEATRNEAARAAVKIAAALPSGQAQACEAILRKALASASDDGTRQAVRAALSQIQGR
jgi:HEAT repeat protein